MKKIKIDAYVDAMGWKIGEIWKESAKKNNLPIIVEGPGAFINFTFDHPEANALKALYTQEMLGHGYLASATVYVSYAHKTAHLRNFEAAVMHTFKFFSDRITQNDIREHLKGGLPEAGFKRLT